MKISNVVSAYGIYNKKPAVSRKKAGSADIHDSFDVSNEARDFQIAYKAASSAPDIREDRVNAIKAQIENGSYNVSAEAVADKMMSWLA